MKNVTTLLAFGLAFASQTTHAIPTPVVTNAIVSLYANVTDPETLSFAPDGTLYVGRDNSGSGGLNSDAVKITRIGPGGAPITDFSDGTIRDPDAVVVDVAGIVSGVPGSVIVGGVDNGVNGRLSRITPAGVVTTIFGPNATVENPSKFTFASPGRLLFTDYNNLQVMVMTNATPQVLINTPDNPYGITLDSLNRLLVSSGTAQQIRLYSAAGVLVSNVFVAAKARSPLALGPGGEWGTNVYFVSTSGNLRSVSTAGVVTEHGTGFAPFEDMAFGPDNALYLSDFDTDSVMRISYQPTLNISGLSAAVQLSWTTNAVGYLLETNTTLVATNGWGVLASNYAVVSTNFVVTNAIDTTQKFYRLHKP